MVPWRGVAVLLRLGTYLVCCLRVVSSSLGYLLLVFDSLVRLWCLLLEVALMIEAAYDLLFVVTLFLLILLILMMELLMIGRVEQ